MIPPPITPEAIDEATATLRRLTANARAVVRAELEASLADMSLDPDELALMRRALGLDRTVPR